MFLGRVSLKSHNYVIMRSISIEREMKIRREVLTLKCN